MSQNATNVEQQTVNAVAVKTVIIYMAIVTTEFVKMQTVDSHCVSLKQHLQPVSGQLINFLAFENESILAANIVHLHVVHSLLYQ